MARIEWNTPGDHRFYSGVDRGVVYVDGIDGVPWNGLTNVNLSPVGGEPRPCYLDGVKVINPHSPVEAAGTIEAFYSPQEFDVCDGAQSVAPGMSIRQQLRTPFCLVYRSLKGTDLSTTMESYRLHFVYNAMVSSPQRSHSTMDSGVSIDTLSWNFRTRPVHIRDFAPSAYMYVDSDEFDPDDLEFLEEIIYGTDTTAPRIPSPNELIYLDAARYDRDRYDVGTYA